MAERRHNDLAWLAWHVAVLSRWDSRKAAFPKLDKLQSRQRRPEMSPELQWAVMSSMAAPAHRGPAAKPKKKAPHGR